MSDDPRNTLGSLGERLAAEHFARLGYDVLAQNHHTRYGELDLVLSDGRTLVFCEVKTRAYDDQGVSPEDQVNNIKQHQITKAAKYYLGRYGTVQPPARFDVVAVVWPNNRDPLIRHTPHAFEATF
jgi:putative endonuclease